MSKPQGIRLSRAKGFDLQRHSREINGLDVVNVARPGPWGNPFIVGLDGTREECVHLHRVLLSGYVALTTRASVDAQRASLVFAHEHIGDLVGKNLACWCTMGAACHRDTLLAAAAAKVRV